MLSRLRLMFFLSSRAYDNQQLLLDCMESENSIFQDTSHLSSPLKYFSTDKQVQLKVLKNQKC